MTSKQPRVRLPARAGLGVQESGGQEVSGEITERLLGQRGGAGILSKLNGNPTELQGYYRFDQEPHSLFLKVIPESYLAQQIEANRFAVFAKKAGVQSSVITSEYPKRVGGGLVVVTYDWIEGRCLELSPIELEEFGRQLGRLHQVLERYPSCDKVRLRTHTRLVALREIAERITNLKQTNSRYLQHLCGFLQENPDFFKPFEEPCQVLHGDLNVGNVRWTEYGVVFLDFEDAAHSWFPPRVDVAFALERLALINEPEDSRALENAQALLRGYVDAFGCSPFSSEGVLRDTLEWLGIRSLCMLQDFKWEGKAWPESEWLKFDSLLDHLSRRSEMMLEIEACFFDR